MAETTGSWEQTCVHHSDAERAAVAMDCPVCTRAALAEERRAHEETRAEYARYRYEVKDAGIADLAELTALRSQLATAHAERDAIATAKSLTQKALLQHMAALAAATVREAGLREALERLALYHDQMHGQTCRCRAVIAAALAADPAEAVTALRAVVRAAQATCAADTVTIEEAEAMHATDAGEREAARLVLQQRVTMAANALRAALATLPAAWREEER